MKTGLTHGLGGTIDAWCGKCKLVLGHTIEALVGEKPTRVSCNTCKSQHAYKSQAPKPSSKGTVKRAAGTASPRARSTMSRYQSLLKSNDVVTKAYSPSGKFEEGDVLEHPTFGRGVATAIKDGAKVEVLFETGTKTLIHGR